MLAANVMIKKIAVVGVEAEMGQIAQEMVSKNTSHVMVTGHDGKLLGLISGYDLRKTIASGLMDSLARDIMTPREKLYLAEPETPLHEVAEILMREHLTQMPVVRDDLPVGYLNLDTVLKYTSQEARQTQDELEKYRQASLIVEAMREGLVVVDTDYSIREFNPAAEELCGLTASQILGQHLNIHMRYNTPITEVMETGEERLNVEVDNPSGQIFLTNTAPIFSEGKQIGVMQTFFDITEMKQMQTQLLKAKNELDKAFALTLPNSRVEHKLKNTPEYRDTYNPKSGLIEITEVIENGGYLHVVNALKVAADLNEKGVMTLLGIDKDTLVQALIFHDVGKSQPVLRAGQEIDPKKVFEDSKIHAKRSAEIVMNFYSQSEDVRRLIEYHHHEESELPADFPLHLQPMLRLVKIIDGLSAGLTRRGAQVAFKVNGTRLTIIEHSKHPVYSRIIEVDLYTGEEFVYTENQAGSNQQEDVHL